MQEAARQLGIVDVLQNALQMSGGQKQRGGRARHGDASAPRAGRRAHGRARLSRRASCWNRSRVPQRDRIDHPHGHARLVLGQLRNRIVFIKDGALYGGLRRSGADRGVFYRKIVDIVSSMGGAGDEAEAAVAGEGRRWLGARQLRKSLADFGIYFLTVMLGVAVFYAFNSMTAQQGVLATPQTRRTGCSIIWA